MPSMYDASVPTITRALKNFIHVLEKGAAHAEAKKIEPSGGRTICTVGLAEEAMVRTSVGFCPLVAAADA